MSAQPAVEPDTLQAVLWDMDGTLVDSEKVWADIQLELLAELGAIWTMEDCVSLTGSDLGEAVKAWMARIPAGVITAEELAERIFAAVIEALKKEVDVRPGALELLLALRAEGVPCALVSASYRLMIDAVLAHFPPDVFDVVVAGDEVTHGKPHPEPYLTAARALGVSPAGCVVIEDSATGADAGTAAGSFVLAVPQWVTIQPGPRRHVIESLESVTPDSLRALLH